MTDAVQQSAPKGTKPWLFADKAVIALVFLIALFCLLPHVAVLIASLLGDTETLRHLAGSVLDDYVLNTGKLVVIVGIGTFLIGTGAAWLVTMTEFVGRRWLEIALVIPLAFPAYVLAYAYTHVLDHPGIVQTMLRDLTGWGPRDYWFPEVRSIGGAGAILTLVLYPYVYLLARAAFLGQSGTTFLAARSLGKSPARAFLSVSLPLARPAIAAGVLLTMMETIADFGTVSYFGVQTFATGIYNSWFSLADRAAAAQLSLGLLAFALLLAMLERANRGRARFSNGKRQEAIPRIQLKRGAQLGAVALCGLPVLLGVIIPTIALGVMALGSEQNLLSSRYLGFIANSLTLAGIAAVVTVLAAILLGSFARTHGTRRTFGVSTGLLFTGSIWLLVGAYMIRFLAAALGAYEGGIASVSRNIDAASRVLGQTSVGTVRRVHVPLLTPSLLTAALIVFVDVMKELPATLIMRPFNFDTLAVQAYRLASDERLNGAAVPSLLIAAIGLLPVMLLCRRVARHHV